MGASGSGKSTFMNILGYLDRYDVRTYLLEGIDVSKHDKKRWRSSATRSSGSFSKDLICWRGRRLRRTPSFNAVYKDFKVEREKRAANLAMVGLADRIISLRRCRVASSSGWRLPGLVNRPSICWRTSHQTPRQPHRGRDRKSCRS